MQKLHSAVYKKFFAQYDLILSLPYLFRFGHAIGRGSSFLHMRQKLPHQLFVGVNIADHGTCRFLTMENFDVYTQQFISGSPFEYIRNIDTIASACTTLMQQTDISYGFDIGLLSEYPKGYGTSFSTILMTLLAVAFFIQEKKIPLEVISNYSFQHTHLFADVCYFASYIKYLATGSAGSCIPFVVLQQQTCPVFQIGTIDFSTYSQGDIQHRLWNLSRLFESDREGSDKKAMGWYPLVSNEEGGRNELPIDIAIIHMGTSYESLREKEQGLITVNADKRIQWFSEITQKQSISPSLENVLLRPYDVYGHMSSLLYTRLFHACVEALQGDTPDESVKEIITILKDMGFYHCLIEHEYEMITLLSTVFSAQKTFPEECCAFLPMTTVKTGGTFLAIIPRHGERKTLETIFTSLQENYGYPAQLLYASWKEGHGSHGGVILHQFISEGLFSSYITPGTAQLTFADGTRKIGEYDVLLTDSSLLSGITFDMIKRKVLVGGKKVTHKVLCSQSATIEIMLYLLDHIGEFIPNHILPPSAYSKTKNEMISKILLPLQEIMKAACNEQMEIICSGMMYEWTICLKKKPSSIHLISYAHP